MNVCIMMQPDVTRTVADVFDLAIEIEMKAEKLYESLAGMFSHEPEVAAFWNDLKDDEADHAEILRKAFAELPSGKVSSVADLGMWVKLVDLKRRIDRCSPDDFKTLEDAYEIAHELEYSEVNGIFDLLASGLTSPEVKVELIDSNIARHQNKLLEFTRTFGGRAWRQSILSKPR